MSTLTAQEYHKQAFSSDDVTRDAVSDIVKRSELNSPPDPLDGKRQAQIKAVGSRWIFMTPF